MIPEIELGGELFDKESGLCGPEAFRRALVTEFESILRRKPTGLNPGLAVLQVKRPSSRVAAAIGETLRGLRQTPDVAARISEGTFAVMLGIWAQEGTLKKITDALPMLEAAARAAVENGAGDVKARIFWLKPEHGSAEEWFREATTWHV